MDELSELRKRLEETTKALNRIANVMIMPMETSDSYKSKAIGMRAQAQVTLKRVGSRVTDIDGLPKEFTDNMRDDLKRSGVIKDK